MSTWWIGSKEQKVSHKVYDALRAMKVRDTIEADDLAKDRLISFLKESGRWDDALCGAHEIPDIFIDGGGSIIKGEPEVGWEANGSKLKTFVRALPFVLESFQELKPNERVPEIYGMGGFHRAYYFSKKTVLESIAEMERLLKGTESLRQELEIGHQRIFNQVEGGISLRKCGCLSGLLYVECCGKSVESKTHKEMREGSK